MDQIEIFIYMYDHYSLAKSVEYGVFNFIGKGRDRAG